VNCVGAVIAEWIVLMLGQHMEGVSTMWHYVNATPAMLVPGVTILNGWPGLPHGQLGPGAKPASLNVIVMAGGARMSQLDEFVDVVLQLRAGFVDPRLIGNGELRPMSRAMGATLIMYYKESWDASEVCKVTTRMRHAMCIADLATNDAEAHQKLVVWASQLQAAFVVSNLHLTQKAAHPDMSQLVTIVQRLATDVATLAKQAKDSTEAHACTTQTLTNRIQDIR
jgi:hypothetical protein